MIRNTILGIAAAAAVTAIALGGNATTAEAHGYKGGYHYGYYKPYHCKRYFAGYRKVWTYYGWRLKPYYKRRCFYGY